MKDDSQLPSLSGASDWLNLKATDKESRAKDTVMRGTKGRPTLVHFWSSNNEVSKNNIAQVAQLRDQHRRDGLRTIAIHSLDAGEKLDSQAVRDSVQRLNVTEPCAIDIDHQLRKLFFNESDQIPAYFLFDTEGRLKASASGEAGLETVEDKLDELISTLRKDRPFCPECKLFLNEEAMFCAECGIPLSLPDGTHPYYENHHSASLPTVRLVNPDPLLGHKIGGKYELIARLGEGGMSVVYKARRVHIGDEVAVKVMLPKFANDAAALARFKREAHAAAILHHPNIITIHDFGETGNDDAPAYIVMEFVKGAPLRELLNSEKHFTTERALRLMRGICAGVGAAHRNGVVHRDLKPDNVIVVPPVGDYEFESVKVVDFGFAKLVGDRGEGPAGTVVGTPYYMSPEQCLGEPLDFRSDVYSLGAMFYELLSGKRPFTGETVSGIISKQLSDPPPPLPNSLGVPRRVSTAIMHALSKDPESRPQTAIDLARQLQLM